MMISNAALRAVHALGRIWPRSGRFRPRSKRLSGRFALFFPTISMSALPARNLLAQSFPMLQNRPQLRLISSRRSVPQPVHLTDPEKRVLDLVLLGEGNKEIARRLCCTVKNVEYHVTNILKRTGMPTRLKLIARMANTSEHRILAAIP
jgi:DNA-binding NarL/FixJ family response regulator